MIVQNSTSAAILGVAIPLFAERPFDAVSTRQIAKKAGVNLSAISYHFGNKEGLYTAIFEKIVEDLAPVRKGFKTLIDSHIDYLDGNPKRQYLFFEAFVSLTLEIVLSQQTPVWEMQLILREMQTHGPNFDLVMQGHVDKMQDLMCECVAVILAQDIDSSNVILTSQSIITLCLQYGMNQELIKSRLKVRSIDRPQIDLIKNVTTLHITRMLGVPEGAEN